MQKTWFTEAHGVTHGTWGPPWKVYWLLTSTDDRSQWWSSGHCQAFVLYEANGLVTGKMWLEERPRGERQGDWLQSFAVASISACSIWMTVRLINRRQRWSRPARVAAAVLSIPAAYLAAFGPACWISSRTGQGSELVSRVYQPILKIMFATPSLVRAPIVTYGHLYSADGWRFSGPSYSQDSDGVKRTDDTCHWQPDP